MKKGKNSVALRAGVCHSGRLGTRYGSESWVGAGRKDWHSCRGMGFFAVPSVIFHGKARRILRVTPLIVTKSCFGR